MQLREERGSGGREGGREGSLVDGDDAVLATEEAAESDMAADVPASTRHEDRLARRRLERGDRARHF